MPNEISKLCLGASLLMSGVSSCFASGDADNMADYLHNRKHNLSVANFYSSGDEEIFYGSWFVGSVGKASYKSRNNKHTGKTKENSSIVMMGSDAKIDDRYTIGACVSFGESKLKSFGDVKTNIKTTIFSLYGDVAIVPNISVISGVYGCSPS